MKHTIEISGEKDIIELIRELAEIMERGNTTITIETETVGDGNNEDGGNEYEWVEATLISEH
jgi:hypothetical protein